MRPLPYPRFVTQDFEPFDPLELAKETEEMVCRNSERKYTGFHATGVYGGIATGYTCGCCLRCVFCWVDWSRDFPERHGRFYSAEEAFRRIKDAARKAGMRKLRISGAEPTLGKDHLMALMELVEESEYPLFILETNGILLGADKDYVLAIAGFKKPHVRISLKAGTPDAFTRKTGARTESFQLPFRAIQSLMDYGVSFHVAAMSADPRMMTIEERENLISKLTEIDPELVRNLEEEIVDPYRTTLARLRHAGILLEWPLKEIHPPIRLPKAGEFLNPRLGRYSHKER